jgi:hypothetical protein
VPASEILLYFVLFVAAAAWGTVVIRDATRGASSVRGAALAGYLFIVTGSSVAAYEFGQREQLFALFFVPFLFARLASRRPNASWPAYLLVTGFLCATKPHFVLLVVWVEGVMAITRREAPLRTWALLAGGVLLPFAILYAHDPHAFRQFFAGLMIFTFSASTEPYNQPLSASLAEGSAFTHGLTLAAVAAISFAAYRRPKSPSALLVLAGLVLLGNAAVIHQHRFYAYHFHLPAACSVAALAYVGGHWLESIHDKTRRAAEGVAGACLVLGLIAGNLLGLARQQLIDEPRPETRLSDILEGHHKVLFVSTSVEHVYGYYYDDVDPVGPWSYHFALPDIFRVEDAAIREQETADYGGYIMRRIVDEQPTAVVFSANNQALPAPRHTFPAAYLLLAKHLPLTDYEASIRDVRGHWVLFTLRDLGRGQDAR